MLALEDISNGPDAKMFLMLYITIFVKRFLVRVSFRHNYTHDDVLES